MTSANLLAAQRLTTPFPALLNCHNPMLDAVTNKRIADCFDILLGKVPDPKSRIEKITIALVYKFRGALARSIVCTGSTT
jgi:hypothetical protein